MYKWTVNWRFLAEPTFLAREFHVALLAGQAVILALFGWRWCWSERAGALGLVRRGFEEPLKGAACRKIGPRGLLLSQRLAILHSTGLANIHPMPHPLTEVAAILSVSNLIGILFARSLHYQFQSWYFHQLPLLVYLGRSRLVGSILLIPIAYGWSTYPSTDISSLGLVAGNVGLLALIWLGDAEGRAMFPDYTGVEQRSLKSR